MTRLLFAAAVVVAMIASLILLFPTSSQASGFKDIGSYFVDIPHPKSLDHDWARQKRVYTSRLDREMAQSMSSQRTPDLCQVLVERANAHNGADESWGQNSLISFEKLAALLGLPNCPGSNMENLMSIHTTGGVAAPIEITPRQQQPGGSPRQGPYTSPRIFRRNRRQTLYRVTFPKRVSTKVEHFNRTVRLAVPITLHLHRRRHAQINQTFRVVLQDQEGRDLTIHHGEISEDDLTARNSCVKLAVLDATKLSSLLLFASGQSDLSPSSHVNLRVKIVVKRGMTASIERSARPRLVFVAYDTSHPVVCRNKIKMPAPRGHVKQCTSLCSRNQSMANINFLARQSLPDLYLHDAMKSVDIGQCGGDCDTKNFKYCRFRQFSYHGIILDLLRLGNPAKYDHVLSGMSCTADTDKLVSVWVPYALNSAGNDGYEDCGVVALPNARIPAEAGACTCL